MDTEEMIRLRNPIGGVCLLACLAALGCNYTPYVLAPVSGTVTLYGEPLRNATVSFEPMGGSDETVIVGPGSLGTTDDDGRYTLDTFKGEPGAVVGTHKVRISTFKSRFEDIKQSDKVKVVSIEHVPWQYNRRTILTYDVTPSGADDADFALTAE